jgi:DNA-nicking Smr family endonuclease
MAKRAKAKKATAAKTAAPEAFYRPFAEIKKAKGDKPKGDNPDAKKAEPKPAEDKRAAATPTPPRKPAARPPRDDAPAPVDPDTFALYMTGVRALPDDRAHRIPRNASRVEKAAHVDKRAEVDEVARTEMRSLVIEGIRFETVDDGDRIEGRRLDVDPRELRRLRRAQYAIDGKLDLHGLGAQEARQAVESFVKKRAEDGDRVVLVVHGKGSHSPRGHGVLRGEIAAWLSQGRASRHVAAFATAPEDHGGSGAVLVLLAR